MDLKDSPRDDAQVEGAKVAPSLELPGPAAVPVASLAFTMVAVAVTIALLRYMADVFIPFVLAGLLFYALDPMVDRLQRWRVPRAAGAALAVILLVVSVGTAAYTLADDVTRVAAEVPAAARKLRATLRSLREQGPGALDQLQRAATAIEQTAEEATGELAKPDVAMKVEIAQPTSDVVIAQTARLMTLASQAILILFLAYFLLLTDDLFKRKLVENIGPTLTRKKLTVQVLNDIAARIERFLMVQVLTSVIVALATGLMLWWLGLRQPAVWGILAGVFNSLPYFGPLIVTIGLALVAFIQFGTIAMALTVASAALLITTVEGWVLTPQLMGRVAQMNTVAVFAGLIFWSWMWGMAGLLLAVPMMMVLKTFCDSVEELQPIGRLLGD